MGKKDEKTNVMRLLDEAGVSYQHYSYDGEGLDGAAIAALLGQAPERCFKTLVTVGRSGANFVFMVPVCGELDLKKAAKAAGEKALEMLPQKQLLPLTGYVHGGCSPIGMKKRFPTFLDESAVLYETICCSGGKVGRQVELRPEDLHKLISLEYADLCKE
ncbi:MAG: Cys-tRNA(Pro) deacylase [Oscillospiraceae bacterium]|nr:Cys-tRNA(Pro) deacylase [Oscillospiraceae bacterium]